MERGGLVVLDYRDPFTRRRKRESLGYRVRDERGRIDTEATRRAEDEAKKRSAENRLEETRVRAEPAHLTVGNAFALYHDPKAGGLPPSPISRGQHRRARDFWTRELGVSRPWNQVTRAQVQAAAFRVRQEVGVPTAIRHAKCLRTLYRWLDELQGIEGLRDPLKGFPWKKLREGHEPHRPRYTQDELAALARTVDQVDPRLRLFFALLDDAGARGAATVALHRSDLDPALPLAPEPAQAPHGWIRFPALKGQRAIPHFLTRFERAELDRAFSGYLAELEARWQSEHIDYPLFPQIRGTRTKPMPRPDLAPVGVDHVRDWLHEAEALAGVPWVRGRAFHGVRRAWTDYMRQAIGLGGTTTAGGWDSERTVEDIYLEEEKYDDRSAAREALERKRQQRHRQAEMFEPRKDG